ncbi:flagellar export protein FliJ [Alcaligenaceae bacterium]|nr:flagellar export protein FliJ [Alcaligenaceae bacterium]
MAKHASLVTLIDLKTDAANQIAKQLQKLQTERNNAKSQLSTLQVYRQDYAERLQKATMDGVTTANYHNFRQFIATLDEAILQQNRVVGQIDRNIEQSQQQWYAEKQRLKSYEALQTRHHQQQLQRENRAEQLANDEASAALYRRTRPSY